MDEVGAVKLFGFGEVNYVAAVASCNAGGVQSRQDRSTGNCTDGSTAGDPLKYCSRCHACSPPLWVTFCKRVGVSLFVIETDGKDKVDQEG